MSLRMIQKPPVIFTLYDPSHAISAEEKAFANHQANALPWLWLSYSRFVMEENDTCMEPNDGAESIIALTLQFKDLAGLKVRRLDANTHELQLGDASLYLTETEEEDVFLYFFTPEYYYNRKEDRRLDLTGLSSHDCAYFIATVFSAYNKVLCYSRQS